MHDAFVFNMSSNSVVSLNERIDATALLLYAEFDDDQPVLITLTMQ
jgi:hypothetical protein